MSVEIINSDKVGEVVQSRKVGKVPAFVGVIRKHWRNSGGSWKGDYYHVENLADGTLWHRDGADLSAVAEKEPA